MAKDTNQNNAAQHGERNKLKGDDMNEAESQSLFLPEKPSKSHTGASSIHQSDNKSRQGLLNNDHASKATEDIDGDSDLDSTDQPDGHNRRLIGRLPAGPPYACGEAECVARSKVFQRPAGWTSHQKQVHKYWVEGDIECPICHDGFPSKYIIKHLWRVHKRDTLNFSPHIFVL